MAKFLKWIAIFIGCFLGLIALAVLVIYFGVGVRLSRGYDVPSESLAIPTDTASIERGRHLVTIGRCRECHGSDLGGRLFIDDPVMGKIFASNLTTGRGGVGRTYTDADWERAIRHGVGPDGQSLMVTPAQYYYYLSDDDVAAIIAYIESVPPVDSEELPAPTLGPLGRIFLTLFHPRDWLPAEKIDHHAPRPPAPPAGPTAAYGNYLWQATTCGVCHDPEELSSDLVQAGWSERDFVTAMRLGLTPGGGFLDNEYMPWKSTSRMTDDELRALWLYLQSPLTIDRSGE